MYPKLLYNRTLIGWLESFEEFEHTTWYTSSYVGKIKLLTGLAQKHPKYTI
jgi:hypothetical protein